MVSLSIQITTGLVQFTSYSSNRNILRVRTLVRQTDRPLGDLSGDRNSTRVALDSVAFFIHSRAHPRRLEMCQTDSEQKLFAFRWKPVPLGSSGSVYYSVSKGSFGVKQLLFSLFRYVLNCSVR